MTDLSTKMTVLKDAVPGAFKTAKNDYIKTIENKGPEIEKAFQSTLNGGFRNVYLTAAIAAVIALLLLLFYRNKVKISNSNIESCEGDPLNLQNPEH
ncbi:MAG: hypothetical protein Q8865_09705, partial [Bacillota bacterium]|nr:hypothetical protein [Bacillota bacterium]